MRYARFQWYIVRANEDGSIPKPYEILYRLGYDSQNDDSNIDALIGWANKGLKADEIIRKEGDA